MRKKEKDWRKITEPEFLVRLIRFWAHRHASYTHSLHLTSLQSENWLFEQIQSSINSSILFIIVLYKFMRVKEGKNLLHVLH